MLDVEPKESNHLVRLVDLDTRAESLLYSTIDLSANNFVWDISVDKFIKLNYTYGSDFILNFAESPSSTDLVQRAKMILISSAGIKIGWNRTAPQNIKWTREPLYYELDPNIPYFIEVWKLPDDPVYYIDWVKMDDNRLTSTEVGYPMERFNLNGKTVRAALSTINRRMPRILSIERNKNLQIHPGIEKGIDDSIFEYFPLVIRLDKPCWDVMFLQILRYGKNRNSRENTWEFRRIPLHGNDWPVLPLSGIVSPNIQVDTHGMRIGIRQAFIDELYRPPRIRGNKWRTWSGWAGTGSNTRHNNLNGRKSNRVRLKFAVVKHGNDFYNKNVLTLGEPSSQTLEIVKYIQTERDGTVERTKVEIV